MADITIHLVEEDLHRLWKIYDVDYRYITVSGLAKELLTTELHRLCPERPSGYPHRPEPEDDI